MEDVTTITMGDILRASDQMHKIIHLQSTNNLPEWKNHMLILDAPSQQVNQSQP